MKTKKPKRCIGYASYEGKCGNPVDKKVNPIWCPRCDEIRRKTIDAQFKVIVAGFGGGKK